jgi:hypothetical protein
MTAIVILIALLVLGGMGWTLWRLGRTYLRFRGTRIVSCPETGEPAAVEMATWQIALASTVKGPALRLRHCSRWSERAACAQVCREQIEASPEDCLVLTILSKWYRDQNCACCGRPVGQISRWLHRPCLLNPDLRMLEWEEIPAETIPLVLKTHEPVCRTCLIAETHTS